MNRKIVITGGTGSLGSALVRFFVEQGDYVLSVSRDVHKHADANTYGGRAEYTLQDICNLNPSVIGDADYVIHAAAAKHVSVGEYSVDEYIRVNIEGTQRVMKLCKLEGVPALFISSDKAVEAINLYGRTKAVGEDIAISYGQQVLRYGNVVESKGAFIHYWSRQLELGQNITVRTPLPTRFFMRIRDAVALVNEVIAYGYNGHVHIPLGLKAFSLYSVAKTMLDHYNLPSQQIEHTNLLRGEKQHEVLMAQAEHVVSTPTTLIRTVRKGYSSSERPIDVSSERAIQMTGSEVLRELKWPKDN